MGTISLELQGEEKGLVREERLYMAELQVSVLMAVYNGEKYLGEAIKSILEQTFADFEFIIINDASRDRTEDIIKSYADSRIKLINNDINLGLAQSLNHGLSMAAGKYVVRMDADDISLPERLGIQVDFMEKHKEVGVAGTWLRTFGDRTTELKFPLDNETLRCNLLFSPQIAHPSVIMRREALINKQLFYDKSYLAAQDFDLWRRCSQHFCLANIDKVLLLYRLHNIQGTISNYEVQQKYAGLVRLEEIKSLGINPTEEEFQLHQEICRSMPEPKLSRNFVEESRHWLSKLKTVNKDSHYYEEMIFSSIIDKVMHNMDSRCKD